MAVGALVVGMVAAGSAGGAGGGASASAGRAGLTRVVVLGSATDLAARAVAGAGGRVVARLPLIGGVAATLPAGASLSGVAVVPDRPLTLSGSADVPGPAAPASTLRATLGLPPTGSEGSRVGLAMVDTGIAAVPDLAGQVKAHLQIADGDAGDGYGHGTFLAGLVAGTGADSAGAVTGVAPGAHLLDVKVADDGGRTGLSEVLRGLQAVADNGDRYGVRVVSLALSSASPLPYQLDPLALALDRLWRQGFVVVVPAGNDGPDPGSVASPGADPMLLTAGGLDEAGTAERTDDSVAPWSGRGPTIASDAKPDLLGPAADLVSLRAPGSLVDEQNPAARVGGSYFRGSGTSMATAVTAAAAAAVLAVQPALSPDDVKRLLTRTAYPVAGAPAGAAGAGGLDLSRALAEAPATRSAALPADPPGAPATWASLVSALDGASEGDAARAWSQLDDNAHSWAAHAWAALDPTTRAWASDAWGSLANQWADDRVTADRWLARLWAAWLWESRSWASRSWASRSWASRSWASRSWASRSWASRSWASRSWASRSWASRSWASRSWASRSWASRSWASRSWVAAGWG